MSLTSNAAQMAEAATTVEPPPTILSTATAQMSIVVKAQVTRRVEEEVSTVIRRASAGDASRSSQHPQGAQHAPSPRPPAHVGPPDVAVAAGLRATRGKARRTGIGFTQKAKMTRTMMVIVIDTPATGTGMGPPVLPLPHVVLVPIPDVRGPVEALLPPERPADVEVPVVTPVAARHLLATARSARAKRCVEFMT